MSLLQCSSDNDAEGFESNSAARSFGSKVDLVKLHVPEMKHEPTNLHAFFFVLVHIHL